MLTTGQEDSIWDGMDLVADLVKQAGERIIVMSGGGNKRNAKTLVARTGAREIHATGTRIMESRMAHRNARCFMGGALRAPEFSWARTDSGRVRALVDSLR